MKKQLIALFFPFFILLSCNNTKLNTIDLKFTTSQGKEVPINVEIAKTPTERNFGFMERKTIPEGTGMIFVFEYDQILSFWMKNTPHPLSIAYIDSRGKIRDIFDMTPYSLASIKSSTSVRYAVEVPQGWFEKNDIKVGDYISLVN